MHTFTVLLAIAFLAATTAADKRSCTTVRGKYVVITDTMETWHGAGHYCVRHGMRLATVYTQRQQDRLNAAVAEAQSPDDGRYWLGGSDLDVAGTFVWSANGRPFAYTNWSDGEPSSSAGVERCVVLWQGPDWKWNNAPCERKEHFVCAYY